MANKKLFSIPAQKIQTINNSGSPAFALKDKEALAQLATTGCLSDTCYTTGESQLKNVQVLVDRVSKTKDGCLFIAKLAVYARQSAFMKDMPALLLSYLAVRSPEHYSQVFRKVISNGKMLRNHVQMVRSGVIDGRKSLPRAMRRQINNWFQNRKSEQLFNDSVGNDPSLLDVIKMVHPKPRDKEQEALFAYLLGNRSFTGKQFKATFNDLPEIVRDYESVKMSLLSKEESNIKVPDVDFRMLDSLGLSDKHWGEIAENAPWHMTRMNLNTFARHNVFTNKRITNIVANRLRSKEEIKKAKVFPYQLLAAYTNATDIPHDVKEALQDAMELAIDNIPEISGHVKILVDVSGSMSSPITGKAGHASSMRCLDVAALIAAALLRVNRHAEILAFDTQVHKFAFNGRDSVFTNSQKLSSFRGGGTDVSVGLQHIYGNKMEVDTIIIVSDNESNTSRWHSYNRTNSQDVWNKIKKQNPNVKMVCIDIQPYTTTQVETDKSILNIGGFSDACFDVIANFVNNKNSTPNHWVEEIMKTEI